MQLQIPQHPDLFLSAVTEHDWKDCYEAVINPQVLSRLDIPTPYDVSKAKDFCLRAHGARYSYQGSQFPIVFAVRDRRRNNKQIGCIDIRMCDIATPFFAINPKLLNPDGRSAEVGYWLAHEYHGLGIMCCVVQTTMAYARDVLHADFFSAACRPNNPASAKTIIKAGLTLTEECDGIAYYTCSLA